MKRFLIVVASLALSVSSAAQSGVIALKLGAPAAHAPKTDADWRGGLTLDHFVQSNSANAPNAATKATLLWDTTALYVRFDCADPGATYADGSRPQRSDQVQLALASAASPADFWLLTVDREGTTALLHAGKSVASSVATTKTSANSWQTKIALPWADIPGVVAARFRLQISRVRAVTGEISSVSNFDYHDGPSDPLRAPTSPQHILPAPDDFMEVSTSSQRSVVQAMFGLATLPSARQQWQPRITAAPLTFDQRQSLEIFSPEETTTATNVADRVRHADLWYDLLVQEGFSFLQQGNMDAAESRKEVQPWVARQDFNKAIRAGDEATAYKTVDALMKYLQRISKAWYVTGVPGDLEQATWAGVFLRGVEANAAKTELALHVDAGFVPMELKLSLPRIGGVRLHGPVQGQFNKDDVLPMQIVLTKNGLRATANGLVVNVALGADPEVTISRRENHQPFWQLSKFGFRVLLSDKGEVLGTDLTGNLKRNEQITGLGERFDSVNQRGKVVTLWQQDAWDSTVFGGMSNDAYKPIPLWHSSTGYSVFWDTRYQVRADLGVERADSYSVSAHGPVFDLYVWPGTPSETLPMYTALTGKPLLPPVWAFEHWAGGGFKRWQSEPGKSGTQAVVDVVKGFQQRDIPLSAVYAEGVARAEPEVYASVQALGVRVLSWGRSQLLGADLNHMKAEMPSTFSPEPYMRGADGKVFGTLANGKMDHSFPYLDFTDPHGVVLLRAYWQKYLDLGVAGTMVDFGDQVPRRAVFADGTRGEQMHNGYAYGYQRAENQIFTEARGSDFILFARGGAPGTEAFAGQMAGDHTADFRGLQESLHGGISASLSGFSNWGSDIGGLRGVPDLETYIRYVEFGAFSPLMRDHGMERREPWYFGDAAVAAYKKYAWLRENLLPYVYGSAQQAHSTGVAIMRAAFSPTGMLLPDEYMFGDDLLVAPVITPGDRRRITLPPGHWVSFWDGSPLAAGTHEVVAPLDVVPVYLRAGALVPMELAANLQPGESMTPGRVAVLMITAPAKSEPSTLHDWTLPGATAATKMESRIVPGGFEVTVQNWPDLQQLIVAGAAAHITEVLVDGKHLRRGDWTAKAGSMIIPLTRAANHVLRFRTK